MAAGNGKLTVKCPACKLEKKKVCLCALSKEALEYLDNCDRPNYPTDAEKAVLKRKISRGEMFKFHENNDIISQKTDNRPDLLPRILARIQAATAVDFTSHNWVQMTSGGFPPLTSVVGGKNLIGLQAAPVTNGFNILLVARSKRTRGCVMPGKLNATEPLSCYFPDCNGEFLSSAAFEVLCEGGVAWAPVQGPDRWVPTGAVLGGECVDSGLKYYIGRAELGTDTICGQVSGNPPVLKVCIGGKIKEFIVFEILVKEDQLRDPTLQVLPALTLGKEVPCLLQGLSIGDPEREAVEEQMHNTIREHTSGPEFTKYRIKMVKKVHNNDALEAFTSYCEHLKKVNGGNDNVRLLFYGASNCEAIAHGGFDERVCDIHSGFSFGAGLCFTEHSSKANKHVFGPNAKCSPHGLLSCKSCQRVLLLSKVALGNVRSLTEPHTQLSHAPPGFHSVKGEQGTHLKHPEFVVYRGEQAYPAYIIYYELE